MDLIGNIQNLGNRLTGQKSGQKKGKPAHKDKKSAAAEQHYPSESRLGQKLDTTA